MRVFLVIGFLICGVHLTQAQQLQSQEAVRAAEQIVLATDALLAANRAEDRVAALAVAVSGFELGLSVIRDGLRTAALKEREITDQFQDRREQLSRLIGVLATIERTPDPVFLVHPSGPIGVARAGQITSAIAPELIAEAESLRVQLEAWQEVRLVQREVESQLRTALIGLQSARSALREAIENRTELPPKIASDPAVLDALLRGSENLEQFAAGLAELEFLADVAGIAGFADRKGQIALPVNGSILRRYGERDAAGVQRSGIIVIAEPLSLVTAPHAATVRYADRFLDYGKVVILEPAPGYLLTFSGLGQLYVSEGEILSQGAPLGLLGGEVPDAQEYLIDSTRRRDALTMETLYIEIRNNGNPVDPAEWFDLERAG